jgi:PTS system galactitol-specific IIA component
VVDEVNMPRPVVSEDLILIEPELDSLTAEGVIKALCIRLIEEGYATPSYCQAVLDREQKFPTGLPTLPYATAIPHADVDEVRETGIAVAILNPPVPFRAMDDPDKVLDVRTVLLLAVADRSRVMSTLQGVSTLVQDQDVIKALTSTKSSVEVVDVLKPLIGEQV